MNKSSSLFFLFLSIYACIESYRLDLGTPSHPEAGMIPFILGAALGILALLMFVITKAPIHKALMETGHIMRRWKWKRPLLAIMIFLSYAMLMESLGFLIATFLMIFFLYEIAEPKKLHVGLLTAVLSTVVSYVLFELLLSAHLPKGILGIG